MSDWGRFWAKVDIRGPDECWPWKESVFRRGYACFRLGKKKVKGHRVAFFIRNGHWPEPYGCHSCDNPPCCNPDHVFEGTHDDNTEDMVAKGRQATGTSNGRAKLTSKDVLDIRANYALCRVSKRELSRRFGVSDTQIGRIVRNETYAAELERLRERGPA